MPSIKKITIKKSFSDGRLTLSDGGHTHAWKKDFVVWEINSKSGVASIENIVNKEGSAEIFREPPHANGTEWSAEILHNAAEGSSYNYSIFWKDASGTIREFDPIISIRPRAQINMELLVPIVAFAFGLFTSFIYWRQQRMKLKRQIETLERNKLK